jgi:drug/metabolite transporter superfamily protein YnfA
MGKAGGAPLSRIAPATGQRGQEGEVAMPGRVSLTIIGVVVGAVGVLWILQGLNWLGQSGGMNGQRRWSWIGTVVLLVGLGVIVYANRRRPAA